MPTALLPSFLTSTLGAPAAALGLNEGLADGCAGAARFVGGALADDPDRRRRSAPGGYTATAVLSSLIGVTTAAWQVGVVRADAWTARGIRVPSRNALLADVVPRLILRATEVLTPRHGHDSATKIALVLYVGYNAAADASAVAGTLWSAVFARAAFLYLSAWMLVALVVLAFAGDSR